MWSRGVWMALLLLGTLGCDEKSDFAESATGPGVDIRCLTKKQTPRAVGDTDIEVRCPNSGE